MHLNLGGREVIVAKAVRIETSTGEERNTTLFNPQRWLHPLNYTNTIQSVWVHQVFSSKVSVVVKNHLVFPQDIFRDDLVLHDPAIVIIPFDLLQICQYFWYSNSQASNVFVKSQKISVRASVSILFLIFTAFAQVQFEHDVSSLVHQLERVTMCL